jgi:hypothetical protein
MIQKYYYLSEDYNGDIIGCYPQSHKMGFNYNHLDKHSLKFIKPDSIPEFTPKTGCFILENKAKLTDCISSAVLSTGFLMSEKAKLIFEKHSIGEHIFYQTKIFHKDIVFDNYYILLFKSIDIKSFIDFKRTQFFITDLGGIKKYQIKINSKDELQERFFKLGLGEKIDSDTIILTSNFPTNVDLFRAPIYNFSTYISSRLSDALEENQISGFMCKQTEWFRFS